ncbi:MAG: hypothetical protein Q7S12_00435 [bacterium]|nr:hypothetical protein [bacterium]
MKIILRMLAVSIFLVFSSCAKDSDLQNIGDRLIKTKVVTEWTSERKKVIQVYYEPSKWLMEIGTRHFGELDPKIGDCVMVWARPMRNGHMLPYSDRDIKKCD